MLRVRKLLLFAVEGEHERTGRLVGHGLLQRNGLKPTAVDRGIESHAFEFGGHVPCRNVVTRRARRATLQQAVRQKAM